MDLSQVGSVLQWFGGGILALLSVVGIGTLINGFIQRRWTKTDRQEAIHETNQTSRIQADTTLVQELLRRVKDLEVTQKETQEKLMALTTTNAEQKKTIEYLEKELDRKDRQIHDIQKESNERQGRIRQLEDQVKDLQAQMQELLAVQRGEM